MSDVSAMTTIWHIVGSIRSRLTLRLAAGGTRFDTAGNHRHVSQGAKLWSERPLGNPKQYLNRQNIPQETRCLLCPIAFNQPTFSNPARRSTRPSCMWDAPRSSVRPPKNASVVEADGCLDRLAV